MKKLITMTIMVLAVAVAMAQAPEKFTYQAVVRNASNALVTDAQVSVRVSILQGNASGNAVYVETHTATTNTNGLLTIEIGGGTIQQGAFTGIDWANGPFFLKTETDPAGGTNYTITSTQQLLSVPYALYSKEAGNGFSGDYNDLTNRPQIPQSVSELANDANYITMDSVPTNVSAFNNDAGYITLEQVPAQVNADWNATEGVAEILNKPTIPTVPTDVSAFNNDVGYITGCVETDPQFNAWDKDYNDLINTPEIPTVPTDVSAFTNDAHYVSNAACEDVDLCALAAALAQLQALVEEQQQRIEELEAQIGTDTTTTPTDTTTVTNGTPCPGTPTVTDYDGNVYNTVLIGNQCWTKENLRVTHYSDGTPIPAGGNNTSNTMPYYYDYSSHSLPLETRGYLYNWPAAMVACPTGWHLPSDAEWTALTDYVGNQSEYICGGNSNYIAKALASTEGWVLHSGECVIGNDPETNNATGFSAVPAGSCFGMTFYIASTEVDFWTSTETSSSSVYDRNLTNHNADVLRYNDYKNNGRSIRCLRNEGGTDTTQTTLPTVITGAVSDITETTATCGGEVTADGGAAVTERGVCWSTLATPTVADAHTSDGTGTGTFTSSITGLTANTTYYVRAYATNSVGTGYGEVVTFTTEAATPAGDGQPCPGTPTVTDHEGNVYNTVQIGNQCWMRDNLRTTTSPSTGTYLIPTAGTGYTYTGKQARWYDNDSATYAPMNYGLLYNWNAAVDTFNTAYGETSVSTNGNNSVSVSFTGNRRGICPSGWHLPSDAEWTQLTDYVSNQSEYTCGGNSSYIAKALASETGWNSHTNTCAVGNDPSANNAMGFSAVPAGYCSGSSFYNAGYYANFCSSSQYPNNRAWTRTLNYNSANVLRSYNTKYNGYSVRCLRNEGGTDTIQSTLPTVITGAVSDITETTATCGGEVIADGGAAVTERGVCWSTSATPTVANAHTSDGTGTGTFTSSITGLNANTTYYVRAYATNSVGTGYGEVVTFSTEATTPAGDGQPCPGTPTVTDHEGNVYNTVQIGDQCWMRDNLRTTTSPSTGTYLIPAANTGYTYTGKQAFWYDNDSATYAPKNYGLFYNWNAAVDTFNTSYGETSVNTDYNNAVSVIFMGNRRGICPAGWHLPSDAEWTTLTDYVKTQSDYVCGDNSSYIAKALASTTGWLNDEYCDDPCDVGYDPSTNNTSGFGVVPAGHWDNESAYYAGYLADFWSSTESEYGSYGAKDRELAYNYPRVFESASVKMYSFSVRCLRDEGGTDTTQTTLPTVITGAVSDITETTATCGGEVTADGGAAVTERGVCWSTSATPTVADAHTSDGTGTGTFTSSITGLTANTTYYVRAYATNSVGTAYGETVTFTTEATTPVVDGQPCPGTPTVTDHEGNVYATVQIGNQCWMRDNLRTTTSPSTGTYLIPTASTGYTYTGKQARWYDNDSATYAPMNYGLLYNWNAAVDTFNTAYGETSVNTSSNQAVSVSFTGNRRGICPAGWHLPSNAEWTQLFGQIDYICYGTGFSAIPAGRYLGSSFNSAGYFATFWTSTQGDSGNAYRLLLNCNNARLIRNDGSKGDGFSVRCLRDDTTQATLPTVITGSVSNVTETTAMGGGEVTADGGAAVTERGVCWSTSTTPTVADTHTSDGTGTGSFTSSITGLTANTTYYVRAYATNSVGTGYGEVVTFTTEVVTPAGDGQPCPGAATVTDYDGNVYNTVQIGDQCWTRENLRTTHYVDGTLIPAGGDNTSTTAPYYYDYSSSGIPLAERGYLYNWPAAMHGAASSSAVPSGVQGVCPAGWHLPSDAEWTILTDYVSSQSDYVCGNNTSYIAKALASPTGWDTSTGSCAVGNDQNVNNATGFSSVPAGYYDGTSFYSAGINAAFWSSTEAYDRFLSYDYAVVSWRYEYKSIGLSVRCLRDEGGTDTTQTTLPTVITGAVSDITENTATCGGEVTADGGAAVTERGVCWSTLATPTVADAHTSDGTGTGTFTSSITGLNANTTYYVRAYATNSVGTGYGEVVTFTTEVATPAGNGQPCPGTPTVTDHEGNIYNTVQIGNQCWMRDNLRTTTSPSTGTYLIPAAGTDYTCTGKQARWYNNDAATYAPTNYGLLYNWNAAVDTFNTTYGETSVNTSYNNAVSVTFSGHRRGICPAGWHLPSDAEWTQLTDYVSSQSEYTCGGNSSYIAKALASTEGWNTNTNSCVVGNDPSANNATGFSAVPAGFCFGSSFSNAGFDAYFWSATQDAGNPDYVYYRYLYYSRANVNRSDDLKDDGFSVRCLRDETGGGTALTEPTVTTSAATDVTETSATLNGSISNPDEVAITTQGFEWKATAGGAYVAVNATGETMTYNLTGLTAGTSYTYRAFVTTAEGTSYGETVSFTTLAAGGTAVIDSKSCPTAPTVTDHEGNVYATVQIGNQCWMRDNLRTTTSPSTGTYLIPAANANYTYTGKQARWYNNDSATYAPMNYGLLYNWNAAVDTFNTDYGETSVNTDYNNVVSVTFNGHRRGICPAGWHLPSDAEWTTLTDYVSSQSEFQCSGYSNYIAKALASTEGWDSYSGECSPGDQSVTANNATGFSAVPASHCNGSSFGYAGYTTEFWSSTQYLNLSNLVYSRGLYCGSADVRRDVRTKDFGISVRCLRD